MRPRSLGFTSILAVFILVGAFFIGLGVRSLVTTQRFLAKASTADGVVVRLDKVVERSREGDRYTLYYPVVRFVTASGQVVEYSDDLGEDPPAYRVGDSVRVLYDPADPQKARLDTWSSQWLGATIQIGVGGLVFVIGVIPVVVMLFSPGPVVSDEGRGGKAPVRADCRRCQGGPQPVAAGFARSHLDPAQSRRHPDPAQSRTGLRTQSQPMTGPRTRGFRTSSPRVPRGPAHRGLPICRTLSAPNRLLAVRFVRASACHWRAVQA
jgi:hypothetical protein